VGSPMPGTSLVFVAINGRCDERRSHPQSAHRNIRIGHCQGCRTVYVLDRVPIATEGATDRELRASQTLYKANAVPGDSPAHPGPDAGRRLGKNVSLSGVWINTPLTQAAFVSHFASVDHSIGAPPRMSPKRSSPSPRRLFSIANQT
jgi:hypothetical protein